MADRIVVMNAGEVEQVGAPLELYDRPRNRFVAGFLGSPAMNFIEGTLRAGAPSRLELADGTSFDLGHLPAAGDGRRVTYGIRPEAIGLAADGIPARVEVVEPTGADTHVLASVGPTSLTCILKERIDIQPGATLGLDLTHGPAHLFDAETGRRIDG